MKTKKINAFAPNSIIRLLCACGKRVKVSLKFAGKTGRCPKCGIQIPIPSLKTIKEKIKQMNAKEGEDINLDIPSLPSLKEIVLEHVKEIEADSKKSDNSKQTNFSRTSPTKNFPVNNSTESVAEQKKKPTLESKKTWNPKAKNEEGDSVCPESKTEVLTHKENPLVKQDSLFNPKQDSLFNPKQDSRFDPKQDSFFKTQQDNPFETQQDNPFETRQDVSFGGKEDSSFQTKQDTPSEKEVPFEAEVENDGLIWEDAIPVEENWEDDPLPYPPTPPNPPKSLQALLDEESSKHEITSMFPANKSGIKLRQLDSKLILAEGNPNAVDALPVMEEEENWEKVDEFLHLLQEIKVEEKIAGGDVLYKGKQALLAENWDEALQNFCQCISNQEDLGPAYYLRAIVYLKKKAWNLAIEDLENAKICGYSEENIEKRHNQIRFMRATQLRNTGAYSEALACLDQISSNYIAIEKGRVYWTRAKFFIRSGALDSALEDIEKALYHHYLKPQVYEAGGKICLFQCEYESAMNYFSAAINHGGKSISIYYSRAIAYLFLNQLSQAWEDALFAEKISLEDSSLHMLKGLILNEQGKYKEADQCFEQAFLLHPENSENYFNRAISYMRRKRYDLAIEDFSKVIQENPKDRVAYLKRAICYQEKTNPNLVQAREDFKKAESLEKETMCRTNFRVKI